jgi:hypothetical protein
MKKIIITLLTIYIGLYYPIVFPATNFTLSAIVWNGNYAPNVISVNPNGNPEILAKSSVQNFSLTFKDNEKNNVSYTITPETNGGSANPTSGNITSWNYNASNEATINFAYSAPSTAVGNKKITITLNDGVNATVSYDIKVFIY